MTAQPSDPSLSALDLSTGALEVLREDGGLVLYRGATTDDGAQMLLLLAAPGADLEERRRLGLEFELRDLLDPQWSACPMSLVEHADASALWLSDPGGDLLAREVGLRWRHDAFLSAAIAISTTVGRMHDAGLIHCDLKPGNILFEPGAGRAWLTGFSVAERLSRARKEGDQPEHLVGTLAYMAPEQTGRMNRPIDFRSDLYALGVIFYEMLSGTLPFSAADPLEWIHCHVARPPIPLSERQAGVPTRLSAIVMKLLAKTGEERFQSAATLEAELRRCQKGLNLHASPASRREGAADSGYLVMPDKLYGRDGDVAHLLAVFGCVAATGRTALTLVRGHAGIGKSSLVEGMRMRLPAGAVFISGKFDQRRTDAPYSTLVEALRALINHVLSGDAESVERWRASVGEAMNSLGGVLADMLPEIEFLLGPQAPPPELSATESSARFRAAFQRLVAAFAHEWHPLVLFLDDLQWMDSASASIIEHVVLHGQTKYLHFIGAYRDDEATPGHPLLAMVDPVAKSGVQVDRVALDVLSTDDLIDLVADALRLERDQVRDLAEITCRKTGGNPFFAGQFLADITEEGLLRFDAAARRWRWDIARIDAKGYTNNLIDLMVRRLGRLPRETLDALQFLSCFGTQASLSDLGLIGRDEQAVQEDFGAAVDAGILLIEGRRYRFAHDRVQEAAYALLPESARAAVHHRIGHAMANGLAPEQLFERIFDVADQINAARNAASSPEERRRAADVNLLAGRKAKAATAYDAACRYLDAGSEALGPAAWQDEYARAFALCFDRAECEISRTSVDEAIRFVDALLAHGRTKVDRARAYVLRMTLQIMRGDVDGVVPTALEGLTILGHTLPRSPTNEDMHAEYDAMRRALGDTPIEHLIDLPLIQDDETAAAMAIIMHLGLAAYFTDVNLYQMAACRLMLLTIRHGLSDASSYGFVGLGLSLGPVFHQFAEGERFARTGVAVTKKGRFLAHNAGTYVALQQAIIWTRPLDEALACLDMSLKIARDVGSLIFACYATEHRLTDLLFRGDPLDRLRWEVASGLAFAEQSRVVHVGDIVSSMQGFIDALMGNPPVLDDDALEARALASGIPIVACFHWVLQVQRHVLLEEPVQALEFARRARRVVWSARCHVQWANHCLYESLAVAMAWAQDDAAAQARNRDLIVANLAELQRWAESCPASFAHRHALVAAELARIEDRPIEAMTLYERAIRSAADNGFTQDLALSCERAAAHAAKLGIDSAANAYLTRARENYLRWSAHAKVALLDRKHSDFERIRLRNQSPTIEAPLEWLDAEAVVKVSQALSGEIVLARLVEKLMAIVIEHAGAQFGSLVFRRGEDWHLEAAASSSARGVAVERLQRLLEDADLPVEILAEVASKRSSVIFDDARSDPGLADDPHVQRNGTRSMLCLPLVAHGELAGVLYLENNLATGVFTPARQAVLETLSSQAAISLHNAELYGRLERENMERRASEAALRKSEERYALAIDAASDGHADWVAESGLFHASPRFLEQWGLPQTMSFARPREMIDAFPFHPEDRPRVLQLMEEHRIGRSRRLEFDARVLRRDEVRWMHVTALHSRDGTGQLLRASVATSDITERRRVEEALRASEERYALALSGANESLFDLDLATNKLYLTPKSQQLVGLEPGADWRDVEEWLRLVNMHPGDARSQRQALVAHLAGRTEWYDVEMRFLLPEGVRWVRQRGRALRDVQGKAYRVVGSMGDISEQKRHQEELRQLEERLRRAQRFEAMGTLAQEIAHDFNNILGAIIGFGDRARRFAEPGTRLEHDLTNVLVAGERGRVLVDSILSFSRGAAGERVPVHVEKVVREALALLNPKLPARVRMKSELSAGRAAALGDATQVHQLVMNLGTNAVQAMPEGGTLVVALRVEHQAVARTTTVGVVSPGSWLVLKVADEGCGISEDVIDKIFDPFFTTKDVGVGTGLGLSLVLRIVTQAGGAIDVDSRLGAGSVFSVYLPCIGEAPEDPAESDPEVPLGAGQRILVVDDEPALLELTTDVLTEFGYAAVGVHSARAALEAFQADPDGFDMLITDQRMPGMSGDTLIRELRRMAPLMPVILVSGFLGEASLPRADGHHADEVLSKPFRRQALAASVARLFGLM